MKGKANKMKKIGLIFFLFFMLTATLSLFTLAADDSFEKSIAAFPESYKPYLRDLHKQYPNWVFEPMHTDLDWQDVVKGEYGEKSLVQSSVTSKTWKSLDEGDYNPSTGAFIFKDGGFVQANSFAVEYFMDPRNFLTEDGIFQFELLGFSENYSVEMIERVLRGSFMSNAKIEYLSYDEKTKKFTTVKTDETYAQVIYEAGKTYDINPCYLASKILNELGSDGSYSVYGNHPDYPGIYNFYNIGATDGSGAIARGLLWAKGGETNKTTYGRPWTTPKKSIFGGAQFLAEEYIAKGQYTGYLQRFNVNPESSYPLYTHQYMTNLTGALSQGYSTYASYASLGMLDGSITFSIPVYENMSGEESTSKTVTLADTKFQYGTVSSTKAVLKTGPAKSYADIKASTGAAISIYGAEVKILSKDFTDSKYYMNMLDCPIWYKVNVTVNSVTYQGYVDGDFIDIKTTTYVPTGNINLGFFKADATLKTGLLSSDYRYGTPVDGDTVSFIKNGTLYITSYNSKGGYDKAKFTVTSTDYAVKDMVVTPSINSVKITLSKSSTAERYGFYIKDENDKFVKGGDITSNSYTFKNLASGSKYTVSARYVQSFGYKSGYLQSIVVVTKPEKAENLSYTYTSEEGLVLKWNIAEKCTGYKIYSYDTAAAKYTRIGTVTSNTGEFVVPEKYETETCFMVRAYSTYGSITSQSAYSDHLEISPELTVPTGLSFSDVTTEGYTLSWEGSPTAKGYRVYRYIPEKAKYEIVANTDKTSIVVENVEPGYLCAYRVKSYRTVNSKTELSDRSAALWVLLPTLKPENLVLNDVKRDYVSLSWDKVNNATKYRIYAFDEESKIDMLIDECSENSYTVTNLTADTGYSFFITAVVEGRGMSYESEKSAVLDVRTTNEAPSLAVIKEITASAHTLNSVKLSWSKVDYAEGYRVYQKKSGSWRLITETADTSLVCKNLSSGTQYQFTVKAYAYHNGKKIMSPKYVTFKTATKAVVPTKITASSPNSTSVKLTWNKVSGATGYRIYYYNTSSKQWKAVKTLAATTYNVTGLNSGTTYTFAIKPYIKVSGVVIWSNYAKYKGTTRCSTPTLKVASPSKGKASFSWNNVSGETGYQIWYSTSSTGTYTKISNYSVNKVSASKTSLLSGKTYYFKVRAYAKVNGSYIYSTFSSVKSLKIK